MVQEERGRSWAVVVVVVVVRRRRRGGASDSSRGGAEALEQIDDVESAHWVDLDDDVSGGTLSLSLPLVLSFLSAAPPATAERALPFLEAGENSDEHKRRF